MANFAIVIVSIYVAVGIVCAAGFVWRGVDRIDPAAHGAPWTFRLLIFPGAVALWPILVRRWSRATQTRGDS